MLVLSARCPRDPYYPRPAADREKSSVARGVGVARYVALQEYRGIPILTPADALRRIEVQT